MTCITLIVQPEGCLRIDFFKLSFTLANPKRRTKDIFINGLSIFTICPLFIIICNNKFVVRIINEMIHQDHYQAHHYSTTHYICILLILYSTHAHMLRTNAQRWMFVDWTESIRIKYNSRVKSIE